MAETVERHEAEGPVVSGHQRRRMRTRAALYEAAMALFVDRGFEDVTVDEIVERAGVAKRTFFLHFPTKDALLSEYGRRVTDEVREELARSDAEPPDQLRSCIRLLARRAQDEARVAQLLARLAFTQPGQLVQRSHEGRGLAELLSAAVRRGQERGVFRLDVDPLVVGLQLVGTFFTLSAEWARGDSRLSLEEAADQAVELVLRGLNS